MAKLNSVSAFYFISFFWLVSEIILGRARLAKPDQKNAEKDKSLKVLWVTIMLSVTMGVLVRFAGIGYLPEITHITFPVGLCLIIAGLTIRWWAFLTLGKYFSSNVAILENHQLVTRGIYRIIRHPAYAGSLLSFAGLGVVFSSWVSFLVIVLPIFLAFRHRIQLEESALRRAFPEEYDAYARKTRRLIPFIY